jgi:hypothetical protein
MYLSEEGCAFAPSRTQIRLHLQGSSHDLRLLSILKPDERWRRDKEADAWSNESSRTNRRKLAQEA